MKVEDFKRMCKELGLKEAADDDPIYSEGPSIIFLHRPSGQSSKADTDSTSKDVQNGSTTPPKSDE